MDVGKKEEGHGIGRMCIAFLGLLQQVTPAFVANSEIEIHIFTMLRNSNKNSHLMQ